MYRTFASLHVLLLLFAMLLAASLAQAEGTLWINVAGRFVDDPMNVDYQEPRIERFDAETLQFISGWASDDRDRAIAQGPDGLLYAATSTQNDMSEIRVWDPDTATVVDSFGSWKGNPSDIAFGPTGTLFVQLPARFFDDPQNPNYQAPQLEEYDPETGAMLNGWTRSDDRERDIAIDGQGNVYATASPVNDVGTIRRYLATDLSTVDDTIGSWKNAPASIEIGGSDDLYVVIPARFFSEPSNPNYQAPRIEVYEPLTGALIVGHERAADTDRQVAVDDGGNVFIGQSLQSNEAHVDYYDASDLSTPIETIGSFKSGFRDIVFAPEPSKAWALVVLPVLLLLRRRGAAAIVAAAGLVAMSVASAEAPAGSSITFEASNLFGTAEGTFHDWRIESADVRPDDPGNSFIVVSVDLASVDTGNEDRDEHLRTADFFEVETYPRATVRVDSVKAAGEDEQGRAMYAAAFHLDLHGVKKTLEGEFVVSSEDPLTVEGSVIVNRLDFGVGTPKRWFNPVSITEDVPVAFVAILPARS